jgi:hypothetical protein
LSGASILSTKESIQSTYMVSNPVAY